MESKKTRILVTGCLGFVGSNLVDILVEDPKNEVVGIDNLSSPSSNIEYKNEKAKYIIADVQKIAEQPWGQGMFDEKQHAYVTLPEKFDIIYHLGAQGRIQPSYKIPFQYMSDNILGTAAVCEYARLTGAKIVYAGSSTFYSGKDKNVYAFTKATGEEICALYSKHFSVSTATCRFFNVFGKRQPETGTYATIIGIFENQLRNNQPLTITWTGEQRRDFTHVSDICRGLIAVGKANWHGEIFNLGTGKNYSINEIADMFGGEKKYIPQRPGEALETLADISETTRLTGWKPVHNIVEYIDSVKEVA
jgi:UDP-glucose 4-epimerase